MLAASVPLGPRIAAERFPEIVWEHSHVVVDRRGCDQEGLRIPRCSPTEAMIREHADAFGAHSITNVYELVDDVTPEEIRRRASAAKVLASWQVDPSVCERRANADRAQLARAAAAPLDVAVGEDGQSAMVSSARPARRRPSRAPTPPRAPRARPPPRRRSRRLAGAAVQRDLGELRTGLEALAFGERLRGRTVESGAPARAESCVDRVARECVGEAVPSSRRRSRSTPAAAASSSVCSSISGAPSRDRLELRCPNASPSTAAAASTLARRRKALDARSHHVADPFGNVAERRARLLGDVARQLAGVERVAARRAWIARACAAAALVSKAPPISVAISSTPRPKSSIRSTTQLRRRSAKAAKSG